MMIHTDMNRVIRECMLKLYGKLFIGRIKIDELEPEGYKVSLYLSDSENPVVIMSDLPYNEFIPFLMEELKKMKLHSTERTKLFKIYNDRKRIC